MRISIRPARGPAVLTMLLIFCAACGPALASEARQRLASFAEGLSALRGDFAQYQLDPDGGVVDSASGRVAMAAPRLFRWDYLSPYQQLVLADGRNLWMFDPELEQASVRPQSEVEANSPLTVLLDPSQLDRQFHVEARPDAAGLAWLRIVSRSEEPEFRWAELGFSETGLARLVMEDLLGQRSVIEFRNWQRNPPLERGEFEFVPPPGVDVIGEPVPQAEVFPIHD